MIYDLYDFCATSLTNLLPTGRSIINHQSSIINFMILLLGASGYIGEAFARELQRRQWPFRPLSRKEVDYSRFEVLLEFLKDNQA